MAANAGKTFLKFLLILIILFFVLPHVGVLVAFAMTTMPMLLMMTVVVFAVWKVIDLVRA